MEKQELTTPWVACCSPDEGHTKISLPMPCSLHRALVGAAEAIAEHSK